MYKITIEVQKNTIVHSMQAVNFVTKIYSGATLSEY